MMGDVFGVIIYSRCGVLLVWDVVNLHRGVLLFVVIVQLRRILFWREEEAGCYQGNCIRLDLTIMDVLIITSCGVGAEECSTRGAEICAIAYRRTPCR